MPSISAIGHLFFARFPPKQITGDIPWIFAGNADPKTTLKNIDGRGGNRWGDGCYLLINYSNAVMGSPSIASKNHFSLSYFPDQCKSCDSISWLSDTTSPKISQSNDRIEKECSSVQWGCVLPIHVWDGDMTTPWSMFVEYATTSSKTLVP